MGNINAEKFCQSVEAAAEQMRKDPDIKKYRLH
jgi:hypothetical protein